jgi:hypothetical protein
MKGKRISEARVKRNDTKRSGETSANESFITTKVRPQSNVVSTSAPSLKNFFIYSVYDYAGMKLFRIRKDYSLSPE